MGNFSRKIARKALRERKGGNPVAIPPEHLAEIQRRHAEMEREDRERLDQYGHVRPIITAEFQGKRLVAVGSVLSFEDAKKWKTFQDFLQAHMWGVLTPEWGKAEAKRPRDERHPVLQWKEDFWKYSQTLPRDADGIFKAVPDAPTRAYLLLAYDLYVVRDNAELQARLVKRLRVRDQFQGARYELFATATFIRAGFDIEFERENDLSGQHNEFIATHRATGQQLVLEAKSRKRRGILGFTGGHQEDRATMKVGADQLLSDALLKPAPYPRAIFIDINYPPERLRQGEQLDTALAEMNQTVTAHQREDGTSPWNMIVFTNHPHAYGEPGVPFPKAEFGWWIVSNRPAIPIDHPAAMDAVYTALCQFGNLPNEFPKKN